MTMLSSNFNNTADTKKPGWYRISFLIIFSKSLIFGRLSSRFPIKIISSRFSLTGEKTPNLLLLLFSGRLRKNQDARTNSKNTP